MCISTTIFYISQTLNEEQSEYWTRWLGIIFVGSIFLCASLMTLFFVCSAKKKNKKKFEKVTDIHSDSETHIEIEMDVIKPKNTETNEINTIDKNDEMNQKIIIKTNNNEKPTLIYL